MILIVDDNLFDAELMASVLRGRGHDCLIANDGHEAIGLMPEIHSRVELILLDLDMPMIDGISALGHFKTHYADIPVVIVTGMEDAENEAMAAKWNVAGFYQKPMTGDMLTTIITQLQSRAQAG
ncbi:MAG: response regulator [Rickettsiales bacterium]